MPRSAPGKCTKVHANLTWAGFKRWQDDFRSTYKPHQRWHAATTEKWFLRAFYKHFTSRLRGGGYYEFSSEEFERIFQGETTVARTEQYSVSKNIHDYLDGPYRYVTRQVVVPMFHDIKYV